MKSTLIALLAMLATAFGCGGLDIMPPPTCCNPTADFPSFIQSPAATDQPQGGDEIARGPIVRIQGPTEIIFLHLITMSPCPQDVAAFTIQNTGPREVTWEAFVDSPVIDVAPAASLLLPGRTARFTVSFNCEIAKNVLSFLEISAFDFMGEIQVRRIPVEGIID